VDVFLSVLSVAGIILGAVLLIMIISLLLSAILYESVFGKRFEIYDSAHLPDLNDYKGLVTSRSHSRQSEAINTRGFTTTMKAMTASGGL